MIMKANWPEHALGAGLGWPDGTGLGLRHGCGVGGANVTSNVRSRPDGLALDWALSMYLQVPG
jgi:hypothetical protein